MKMSFILLFIFQSFLIYGQNLSKSETIDYINNTLSKNKISIDKQGIITIIDVAKFYYKDVEIGSYPFYRFQIQFSCIDNNECIENLAFISENIPKYDNKAIIFIDDKEEYHKILNAFDYLFNILKKENLQKTNSDPFSKENYKKH